MRTETTDSFYALQEDDKFWMDQKGKVHSIECMDIKYVFNTVKMIQKRNRNLKHQGYTTGYIIPNQMLERLEALKITNPEYFL